MLSTPTCVPLCRADEKHGNGADTYLHRVGRAGRFGTKGLAITFVASPADSEVRGGGGPGVVVTGRAGGPLWSHGLPPPPFPPPPAPQVLNQVQERFDVDIKPLPEHIDASTYMNAV